MSKFRELTLQYAILKAHADTARSVVELINHTIEQVEGDDLDEDGQFLLDLTRMNRDTCQKLLEEFQAKMLPLEIELRQNYDLSDVDGLEDYLRED